MSLCLRNTAPAGGRVRQVLSGQRRHNRSNSLTYQVLAFPSPNQDTLDNQRYSAEHLCKRDVRRHHLHHADNSRILARSSASLSHPQVACRGSHSTIELRTVVNVHVISDVISRATPPKNNPANPDRESSKRAILLAFSRLHCTSLRAWSPQQFTHKPRGRVAAPPSYLAMNDVADTKRGSQKYVRNQKTCSATWCAADAITPIFVAVMEIAVYIPILHMLPRRSMPLTFRSTFTLRKLGILLQANDCGRPLTIIRAEGACLTPQPYSNHANTHQSLRSTSRLLPRINRKTVAALTWATRVARAAPVNPIPRPKGVTKTKSKAALMNAAVRKTFNGVRESCCPRHPPWATLQMSTAGSASARIRRYSSAAGSMVLLAPMAESRYGAVSSRNAVVSTPRVTARNRPLSSALLLSPLRSLAFARATRLVVAMLKNAVSIKLISGSAKIAPNAGRPSFQISFISDWLMVLMIARRARPGVGVDLLKLRGVCPVTRRRTLLPTLGGRVAAQPVRAPGPPSAMPSGQADRRGVLLVRSCARCHEAAGDIARSAAAARGATNAPGTVAPLIQSRALAPGQGSHRRGDHARSAAEALQSRRGGGRLCFAPVCAAGRVSSLSNCSGSKARAARAFNAAAKEAEGDGRAGPSRTCQGRAALDSSLPSSRNRALKGSRHSTPAEDNRGTRVGEQAGRRAAPYHCAPQPQDFSLGRPRRAQDVLRPARARPGDRRPAQEQPSERASQPASQPAALAFPERDTVKPTSLSRTRARGPPRRYPVPRGNRCWRPEGGALMYGRGFRGHSPQMDGAPPGSPSAAAIAYGGRNVWWTAPRQSRVALPPVRLAPASSRGRREGEAAAAASPPRA
eukprot:scaffold4412_cov401-Prasinococcus_capsulatus_cf.AAC.1